jgi:hypothetical protein
MMENITLAPFWNGKNYEDKSNYYNRYNQICTIIAHYNGHL